MSYTVITGVQELQAELSQEDLGASPLPDHPTVVLLPAFYCRPYTCATTASGVPLYITLAACCLNCGILHEAPAWL